MSPDGNYYLYITVNLSPTERHDKYLGKLTIDDPRVKLIITRKEASNALQALAISDSKKLGIE